MVPKRSSRDWATNFHWSNEIAKYLSQFYSHSIWSSVYRCAHKFVVLLILLDVMHRSFLGWHARNGMADRLRYDMGTVDCRSMRIDRYFVLLRCGWISILSIYTCFLGIGRFVKDIRDMLGFEPGWYWRVCWVVAGPLFLLGTIMSSFINYQPLTYQNYVYPLAANIVGWIFGLSATSAIPIIGIYKFINAKGDTCYQVHTHTHTSWWWSFDCIICFNRNCAVYSHRWPMLWPNERIATMKLSNYRQNQSSQRPS